MNEREVDFSRYARQMGLPGMGRAGQEKLLASNVLVVGAGGLGSPILCYLAAAGVGTIGILDGDEVSVSNLNRQILHWTEDVGRPKTDSAREKILRLNPDVAVNSLPAALTSSNAARIVAEYDVVLSAVDNLESRLILNEACFETGVPWIDGGVDGFSGMVGVYVPPGGPCYRCLTGGTSRETGHAPMLLGALAGTIGTLQAQEALKLILGVGKPLVGRVLFYDALEPRFDVIEIPPDPDCPVCGSRPGVRP